MGREGKKGTSIKFDVYLSSRMVGQKSCWIERINRTGAVDDYGGHVRSCSYERGVREWHQSGRQVI